MDLVTARAGSALGDGPDRPPRLVGAPVLGDPGSGDSVGLVASAVALAEDDGVRLGTSSADVDA